MSETKENCVVPSKVIGYIKEAAWSFERITNHVALKYGEQNKTNVWYRMKLDIS